jgi:uncharacterized protein (DUF2141 family)
MKLFGLGLALALSSIAGAAWAGDVTLNVTGVQPSRGGVLYAVIQTRGQFMQAASTAADQVKPDGPKATFHLRNVPAGEYTVSVLHDTNGNNKMDTAPNGVPTEGWAMPGGEHLDHQPTFDEMKIAVPATGATLSATMVYMDGKIPGQPSG